MTNNLTLQLMRTQELHDYLNSIPEDIEYEDHHFCPTKFGFELIVYTSLGEVKIMWYDIEEELIRLFEGYETVLEVKHDYSFVFRFKLQLTSGITEYTILDIITEVEEAL